ncbi:hypothetical protein SAMN04488062_102248 [Flavobacterium omnivorum]|uniref:Uncharacterized protein n=1 Tax=Flavobacterium omnivorum TaxID=178355 RepID=A0A1G7XDB4_9FLAO|nr:hypothetical protein [Flavobacterium omnivorum]SDG81580.1 hypothetical protein SAMN04488062_102248 [Flavobacterium omnivorum]
MLKNKLKINLFGEAWTLKRITISNEQKNDWEKIALKMNQSLCQAIIDPYFYYILNEDTIQSMNDLVLIKIGGLINNQKNQIEIWYKNRKVQKLKINDLQEELLLFPLYNTSVSRINPDYETGIYIEQKEIGLIGSYEIRMNDFNINNLEFHLLEVDGMIILKNLKYQNQNLKSVKSDALITFQNGFEVRDSIQD